MKAVYSKYSNLENTLLEKLNGIDFLRQHYLGQVIRVCLSLLSGTPVIALVRRYTGIFVKQDKQQ